MCSRKGVTREEKSMSRSNRPGVGTTNFKLSKQGVSQRETIWHNTFTILCRVFKILRDNVNIYMREKDISSGYMYISSHE